MGINRGSLLSVETHFVSFLKTFFFFIQLEEFRMNKIILIGLFLSVITVELKSLQREKAAGNAEQRERQLDQESATFESRDENGEGQVLQKLLRSRQLEQLQEANSPEECMITEECNRKYKAYGGILEAAKYKEESNKKHFPDTPFFCKVNACDCMVSCFSNFS